LLIFNFISSKVNIGALITSQSNKTFLFDHNTLVHLRILFSFFLLPIFCFSISQTESVNWFNTLIVFIVLHLFIYPASNIYNSFMDEDKGSIGGLKNPPPITKKLFYVSIIFDAAGLLLCLFINWQYLFLMMIYIAVSKAYSWKKLRLKRYGLAGWLVVMLFQGGYTYLLVTMAAEDTFNVTWFTMKNLECMLIASLLIGAFYPLTQIYQHEEDSARGDYTISYKLGVRGTFIFSAVLFVTACIAIWHYFISYYSSNYFTIFFVCLAPVLLYFFYWLYKAWRNSAFADYTHTMRMTFISSCSMILCWSIVFYLNLGK
jgi:1,4-dihydroxy-2-naphthoate octaprenyltransferase